LDQIIRAVAQGIPIGCVFALIAVGIVLTYKTSGVLNLAFGAQAFVSAALFYVLRDPSRFGWPMVPAFIVSVVILGPALGWLLDRVLYRHLRTAPPLTKLVTSLGLLVAIPQIVKLDFLLGSQPKQRPPGIAGDSVYTVGAAHLSANEVATIVITLLLVLGLTLMFRFTNIGLQMRAVVESPRMTELAGVNADRVGSVSWMLSSFFAGLAGVLVAPIFQQVSDAAFFTLLVAALAAAAFGKLVSIPLTLLGGILLGVGQHLFTEFLPSDNIFSAGIQQALPFAALFLLLLFWPGLRQRPETTDPLASVDPPPPVASTLIRPRALTIATRILAVVVIGGFLLVATFWLSSSAIRTMTQGIILSLIFLSLTIVTGLGGQISLCQTAFAATGAFATAQLVSRTNMSVLLAIVIGAVIAAAVGALVALPALRLGGIYLALGTLAFAVMFEYLIAPQPWASGANKTLKVPRPTLFGIDFGNDKNYLYLCMVLLAIFGGAVLLIKFGTTGRFMAAMRGSETAARSLGINPATAKITAFALSGAVAGFGGGLLASLNRQMSGAQYSANFTFFVGLVWVVLVISLGSGSVQAAINAGISFYLFPIILDWLLNHIPFLHLDNTQTLSQTIAFILFGLGAITYAKNPEGILEANTRKSLEFFTRLGRRRSSSGDSSGTPDVDVTEPGQVAPAARMEIRS
jgi:branched-subunit amino acid ABC-type transport system permease component